MSKVYVNVPKQDGIRKNIESGKYQALKKIKGKQYAATFDTIREAQHWRNTFNGEGQKIDSGPKTTSTLRHVWRRMQDLHFPSLEVSTQRIWLRRFTLLEQLADMHMEEITPSVISNWIKKNRVYFMSDEYKARGEGCSGRCNFDNELNLYTTIFNWYKDEEEFEVEAQQLSTPIRPRHKKAGFIKVPPVKPEQKKITVENAFKMFSSMNQLYMDLAMTQYFAAGRIGEIAGIQISNIYLDQNYLMIRDSISWCNDSKMFEYLKPFPKNGEPRQVYLHSMLKEIILRRLELRHPGCDFLFHIEGKPLNYGSIQQHFRTAQKRAGIPERGTHCLRHGMATLARRVGGSGLDSVIAMTGHKDLKLADHYSKIDGEVQKETSLNIVEHIKKLYQQEVEVSQSVARLPLRLVR